METLQIQEVGEIKEIKKNIAKVAGLSAFMNGQLLDITRESRGMIMGFDSDEVLVLLLGKTEEVKVGDRVYNRMTPFSVPVGEAFVGRIVNALAEPVDGKGPIASSEYYPVFGDAPGVLDRQPIREVFQTGTLIIDATIPIGKGQRELIIGDRMTGKTNICIDAILNQKRGEFICIYCCIGRAYSTLQKAVKILKTQKAFDYTIVVSATASTPSGEQYIAPYTACALGEYFMHRGKAVFVVFDDLTKHAWSYRQLSLLLERSPGRDAYPGDVFYLHSQLMERAAKLKPELGGGSMTFFPIVDTLQGDITGYISSNLVSMTDGQIYLNAGLFSSGFKPAIDLGLSVSRIGNKVQSPAMKELSKTLRLEYLQYNELLKLTRFKTSVSEELDLQLKRGAAITQLFLQDKNMPLALEEELIFLYALKYQVLDMLLKRQIEDFKKNILKFAKEEFAGLVEDLSVKKVITPEIKDGLNKCLVAFFKRAQTQ